MKKIRRYFYFFLGCLCFIICCNIIVVSSASTKLYEDISNIPFRETALVLGANKKGKNGINPYFKYRMEAAAELYFSKKVNQIIVSGDNHISTYNETDDMANYLIKLGVPDEKIIRDYAGFRTLDSVIRAKKVFNCSSLTLVSQKFHNQRALFIADQNGIDAVAFNAKDVQSYSNYTHTREFLAKTLVILDIFIFDTGPKFL